MHGTVSSCSSLRSSPSQHSLHPKALSDSSLHPLHNSRAPSHSRNPNRQRNGKSSHAQRVYSLGDMIGKCGMKSARRGWRAGDGRARIRPRRRSGCTRFLLTPVCSLCIYSSLPFFFGGSTKKTHDPDCQTWIMTHRRKLARSAKRV